MQEAAKVALMEGTSLVGVLNGLFPHSKKHKMMEEKLKQLQAYVEKAIGVDPIPVAREQLQDALPDGSPDGVVFYVSTLLVPVSETGLYFLDGKGVMRLVAGYGVLAFPQKDSRLISFHPCFRTQENTYHPLPLPYPGMKSDVDEQSWGSPAERRPIGVKGMDEVEYLDVYNRLCRKAAQFRGALQGVITAIKDEREFLGAVGV